MNRMSDSEHQEQILSWRMSILLVIFDRWDSWLEDIWHMDHLDTENSTKKSVLNLCQGPKNSKDSPRDIQRSCPSFCATRQRNKTISKKCGRHMVLGKIRCVLYTRMSMYGQCCPIVTGQAFRWATRSPTVNRCQCSFASPHRHRHTLRHTSQGIVDRN